MNMETMKVTFKDGSYKHLPYVVINKADFSSSLHTAYVDKPASPHPPDPDKGQGQGPGAPGGQGTADLKAKIAAYDKGLDTSEGREELTDRDVWPNARIKELAGIIGMPYGETESGDNIRARAKEEVKKAMEA